MKIGIVIPALNEAKTVGGVIASVIEIGHVIVVDDGSTDGTSEVAEAAGATVVRHKENSGYDAALASGYARAIERDCDAVATIDADGQISVADLKAVLERLHNGGADMVIGIREKPARFAEAWFGAYTKFRFGVPDILCGLKAFTASVYHKHGSLTYGNSINTAMFLAALRDGVRYATVPVSISPREGESRFGSGLRANWRILKVILSAIARDCRPV